jgi:carbon storage regulator CsrA
MLVLSRKFGESIDVDGPCRIVVMPGGKGWRRVKIGIVADQSVTVIRTEVAERIAREAAEQEQINSSRSEDTADG